MSFTIPNLGDAGFPDQAEPDAQDFRIVTDASSLTGVVSGCAVTAQGSPDMTVAVAAGTVLVAGVLKTVSSGNVTISAADGTNPRFDLVVADSTGAKQRRGGTAAANPVFPAPSAGDVVLAAVYVPASDTTINSNQIVDKRISLLISRPAIGASVYHSTGTPQTVTNGAQPSVAFDLEHYDTHAFHDNVTGNSRFTIPTGLDGKYRVAARLEWSANATGVRDLDFMIDGSTRYGGDTRVGFATYTSVNFSTVDLVLAAGQFVECRGYQDSGSTLTLVANVAGTRFSIAYLGT